MAAHSRILARKVPWTEGPGGLECVGSQRVGDDRVTGRGREGSTEMKILESGRKVR